MRGEPQWTIEAFDSATHDTGRFDLGVGALYEYLRSNAGQDQKRNLARVFVATAPGDPRVLGYYTVSAATFRKEGLPPRDAKRLPRYPVPAAILGRMAVDASCQGTGLGQHLLVDGCHRVVASAEQMAVYALIVDAKSEPAKAFYLKYGFIPFVDQPMRLFLPIETLRRL